MVPDGAEEFHAFKLRIPPALWRMLRLHAHVQSRSINSVIVEAVQRLIDEETTEATFDAMVADVQEEYRNTLGRLGDR